MSVAARITLDACNDALASLRDAFAWPMAGDFRQVDPAAVTAVIDALDKSACEIALSCDDILRERLDLHRRDDPAALLRHEKLLHETPRLEFLFLFHGDGRLRAAALDKIDALSSAWMICALARRLNDWAEPVRRAAQGCANRLLPGAAAPVIAEAAETLLPRLDFWRRMGENEALLETAFARPDVVNQLAARLFAARSGSAGEVLRYALKDSRMDVHLDQLAGAAVSPAVRAVAWQTLFERSAGWRSRWNPKWESKILRRRNLERRDITVARDRLALIEAASRDRSALVRQLGSEALEQAVRDQCVDGPEIDRLAAVFAADQHRRVSERGGFVRWMRAESAAAQKASKAGWRGLDFLRRFF